MKEMEFIRIVVVMSLGIFIEATIISPAGICHAEECSLYSSHSGTCPSVYGTRITCYREHFGWNGNRIVNCTQCFGTIHCNTGGKVGCSLYSKSTIWDYNFFMISFNGLQFPDTSRPEAGYGIGCAQLPISGNNKPGIEYQNCPTVFYELGTSRGNSRCGDECNDYGRNFAVCSHEYYPVKNGCVKYLPNYLAFGPYPVITDSDRFYKISQKRYNISDHFVNPDDLDLKIPKYASDSDCQNGDIVIIRDCIKISELKLETHNFMCDSEVTPRRIILLAKKELTIDEDLELGGGINQGMGYPKLSRVILASRQITICGERKIIARGVSGSFQERRPDKAKGQKGPSFVIIGIKWLNQKGLTISTLGGDSACSTEPKFTIDRSFNYPQGFVRTYPNPITYEVDLPPVLSEMSYIFHDYYQFGTYHGNLVYAIWFEVYNLLRRVQIKGGEPGSISVFGQISSETESVLESRSGISNDCPHPSENITMSFQLSQPSYYDNQTLGWKWAINILEVDNYEKFKNAGEEWYGDDDIDILCDWTYASLNEWMAEESITILNYINPLRMSLSLNSPNAFYDDLVFFLTNTNQLDPRIIIKGLEFLQGRIEQFFVNTDFVKWVYTVTTAHILRLKTSTRFIIQLDRFVADKLNIITRLSTFNQRQSRIQEIGTEYERFNDRKIKDAESLLRTDVLPALEEIREELGIQFTEIGKELNATYNIRPPRTKREEQLSSERFNKNFENGITAFATSQILNLVGSSFQLFLGLFVDVGKKVGGIINAGPKLPVEIQEKVNIVKIPPGYKMPQAMKESMEPVIGYIQLRKEALELEIISIIKNLEPDPDMTDFKSFFENKLKDLKTQTHVKDDYELVTRIEDEIRNEVEQFKEKHLSEVSEVTAFVEKFNQAELRTESRDGVAIAEAVYNGYTFINPFFPSSYVILDFIKAYFKETDSEADKREEMLKHAQDIFESLRLAVYAVTYAEIFKTFVPMVNDLLQTFDYLTLEFNNAASLASLDVTAWKLSTKVQDLRQQLYTVLHEYPSGIDVDYLFGKLEYFLDIVYVIFQRIEETKNQKVFAAFLTDIAETNNIDPAVANYVHNLNNSLLQSIILFEVNTAKVAFNQWAFPFASVFLKNLQDYEIEFGSDVDLQSTLDAARNLLEGINNALNDYQYTVVKEVDRLLQVEKFERDDRTLSFPFYTWKYNEYKIDIRNLLLGKSIIFTADVQRFRDGNQHCDKEAIKFNSIGLNLRNTVYPEKQEQLDRRLKGYKVIMTHLGDSYYYFQGKNYLLSGDSITFLRGYSNSDHSTYNLGAKKVSEADPVLSPYTDWNITLQRRDGFAVHAELLELGLGSDLELVGEGSFLGEVAGDKYTDTLVDKFYTAQDNVKPMFKCTGPISSSRRSLIDVMMSSNDGEIKNY